MPKHLDRLSVAMGRGATSIAELIEPHHRARPRPSRRESVAREAGSLRRALVHFERLMELAEEEKTAARRAKLQAVAWTYAREVDPIRVLHASQLLGVSDHTVAQWIGHGVLDLQPGSPRRVTLESVLRAKEVVDELRELGQNRDLLSAVLNRLEREELTDDGRFQRSLGQMRAGERGEWPSRWAGKV